MHAILATIGTDGDVFPYVGLGARLRGRGHHVTVSSPAARCLRTASSDSLFHSAAVRLNAQSALECFEDFLVWSNHLEDRRMVPEDDAGGGVGHVVADDCDHLVRVYVYWSSTLTTRHSHRKKRHRNIS